MHHFEDAHDTDVTMVKFLKPFPLLLTGDMEGNLFIWMAGGNYQCIMNWINTPGIMQFSQIYHLPITQIITLMQIIHFPSKQKTQITLMQHSFMPITLPISLPITQNTQIISMPITLPISQIIPQSLTRFGGVRPPRAWQT